jgi:hypothetical protein
MFLFFAKIVLFYYYENTLLGVTMMHERTGGFSISKIESAMFGDYNPLHVDLIFSRRLQFGKPVIHGVHHLLRAIEAIFMCRFSFSIFLEVNSSKHCEYTGFLRNQYIQFLLV